MREGVGSAQGYVAWGMPDMSVCCRTWLTLAMFWRCCTRCWNARCFARPKFNKFSLLPRPTMLTIKLHVRSGQQGLP